MNAYFACHAHAHALHLCSLTRSVQCFQQLRDDGVVEQSASQSGYGAAIKHCDQPVVLKLNPFLFRNQVAELSGVESFTNAQAQHDGLFDVLGGSDAFTAAHGTLPSLMAVPHNRGCAISQERNPLPSSQSP